MSSLVKTLVKNEKLFEEKEKEMQETQRMVANKLASAESRAVNAQQKLEDR